MGRLAENSPIRRVSPPDPSSVQSWQLSLRQAMFEALDPDSVREIVRTLVAKAKAGDLAAARLVLSYAVGGTTVQVKHAVIVNNNEPPPLPTAPSRGLPGTDLKLVDMAARAERGLPACDPRDLTRDES